MQPFQGAGPNKASGSIPTHGTATGTSGLMLAANAGRFEAYLSNNGAVTMFVSQVSPATVNDLPIPAGLAFRDTASTGAWYAITGGTSCAWNATEFT